MAVRVVLGRPAPSISARGAASACSIAFVALLLSGDPGQRSARPLPPGLGYWPAAAGLALFTWIELVYDRADEPLTVVLFVSVYSLAHLVAAARFGEAWFGRGDAFEVYSTLVGSFAPIGRRTDGDVSEQRERVRIPSRS